MDQGFQIWLPWHETFLSGSCVCLFCARKKYSHASPSAPPLKALNRWGWPPFLRRPPREAHITGLPYFARPPCPSFILQQDTFTRSTECFVRASSKAGFVSCTVNCGFGSFRSWPVLQESVLALFGFQPTCCCHP